MLPIHQKSGQINFFQFVRQLEAKHGFDFHDMAQRYEQQVKLCKARGINHTKWYNKKFTDMNAVELEVKELGDAIPYQNVWHWLIDNDFDDITKGPDNILDLSEDRLSEEMPDYVAKFFRIMRDELNAEGITEDDVEFYVD